MTDAYTNEILTQKVDQIVSKLVNQPLPPIQPPPKVPTTSAEVASLIDHTLLAPASTLQEVRNVCSEAKKYKACTVCVNSSMIPIVSEELKGSGVHPISVVGFPFGSANTEGKVREAQVAVEQGAKEIDMVNEADISFHFLPLCCFPLVDFLFHLPLPLPLTHTYRKWNKKKVQNIGLLKSGRYLEVYNDVLEVSKACGQATLKVIIETSLLTAQEIIASSYLSCLALQGDGFIKTSTGYGGGGAKADDIRVMYEVCQLVSKELSLPGGRATKVKASGGIRSLATVREMVQNGAQRVGASGTSKIISEVEGGKVEADAGGY
ncbi:deoxyribose-phosphate aldolase [Violaceomyces palustris]|uniref:Deoxyribose-phosphate aldolase n=1 Tax=Violaceomyces palustris TaxID=1673888 RepID=A0ACD0P6W7_9BASI|nr:deoxyribose-phosphate aldolase [Violaceomyces palustris]